MSNIDRKKIAVFLSVRDKSTRFPHKVRKIIQSKTVTEHLIDRLRLVQETDNIILTTSHNPGDDWLVSIARKKKIPCFRGDEEDKLKRYVDAAEQYGIAFCVIVDGDDIFSDWHHIDQIILRYKSHGDDYIFCKGLPLGITGFGVKIQAMKAVVNTKTEKNTEVWGAYFSENTGFKTHKIDVSEEWNRPDYRLTLDYPTDFQLFELIYQHLFEPGKSIELKKILKFLDDNPEIAAINRGAQALYDQHIEQSRIRSVVSVKERA